MKTSTAAAATRQWTIKLEVSCASVVKNTAFLKEKTLSSAPVGWSLGPVISYLVCVFPWGLWSLNSVTLIYNVGLDPLHFRHLFLLFGYYSNLCSLATTKP